MTDEQPSRQYLEGLVGSLSDRLYSSREIWSDEACDETKKRAQDEADLHGVPVHIVVHGTRAFTARPSRQQELEKELLETTASLSVLMVEIAAFKEWASDATKGGTKHYPFSLNDAESLFQAFDEVPSAGRKFLDEAKANQAEVERLKDALLALDTSRRQKFERSIQAAVDELFDAVRL